MPYGASNFAKLWQSINFYLNLKENDKKLFEKKTDIIFFDSKRVANVYLKEKIKRNIKIFNYNFLFFYTLTVLRILRLKSHYLQLPSSYEYNNKYTDKDKLKKYYGYNYKIYLKLDKNENLKGEKLLENFKIEKNEKWICVHNRDSSYKSSASTAEKIEENHIHRNFSAKSMLPALKEFSDNGYYVLRMGSESNEILNTKEKKIIDYVNLKKRSGFTDLFFLENCQAYFGSDSGISTPCIGAMKPISYINFSPCDLHTLSWHKCIHTIFKRIKKKNDSKNLSLKEIFEQNVYGETSFINLNNHGYEMKNNTDHEIKELAKEVCEFLNGKTVISENQKNFYKEIKNIFKFYKKENLLGPNPIMIGEDFIKKNMDYIN